MGGLRVGVAVRDGVGAGGGLAARWAAVVGSDAWEAALMLAAYGCARWAPRLRATALFLQVYALAVVTREALGALGRALLRAACAARLASPAAVLRVPWPAAAYAPAAQLAGFLATAALAPLLPLYAPAAPLFALYAMHWRASPAVAARPAGWQRVGAAVYEIAIAPYLRAREETGQLPRARSGSAERQGSAGAVMGLQGGLSGWASYALVRLRWGKLHPVRKLVLAGFVGSFALVVCGRLLPLSLYKAAAVGRGIATVIGGFVVFFVVMVSFVLVTGVHGLIVMAIGLEVVMSMLGVELETTSQELAIWACFCVPAVIYAHSVIFEKVMVAALCALRRELGAEHRLSKISKLYFDIPINGTEAAVKLSDLLSGNPHGRADRHPEFLVITIEKDSSSSLFDIPAENRLGSGKPLELESNRSGGEVCPV